MSIARESSGTSTSNRYTSFINAIVRESEDVAKLLAGVFWGMPKPQLNNLSIHNLTTAIERYETVDVASFAVYGREATLRQVVAFLQVILKERPQPGVRATLWGLPYILSTEVPEGCLAIGFRYGYGYPTPAEFSAAIAHRIEGEPPQDPSMVWSYVLNLT